MYFIMQNSRSLKEAFDLNLCSTLFFVFIFNTGGGLDWSRICQKSSKVCDYSPCLILYQGKFFFYLNSIHLSIRWILTRFWSCEHKIHSSKDKWRTKCCLLQKQQKMKFSFLFGLCEVQYVLHLCSLWYFVKNIGLYM